MNKISISALAALASVACQAQFSELWHQTYDDPTQHGYDGAFAVAVDKRGNTYITGRTETSAHATDYITIKYSPSGAELWHKFYDGGNSDGADIAHAIAVDNDGNVYVTGESQIGPSNPYSYYGFATIKYRSSDGLALWVRRLDYAATDCKAVRPRDQRKRRRIRNGNENAPVRHFGLSHRPLRYQRQPAAWLAGRLR